MSESIYNFDTKGRIPVIPLSYEYKDLAVSREFVVDYVRGTAYVKTEDGSLINICTSEDTMNAIADYLKANPDIIADIVIITDEGAFTIKETFNKLFDMVNELENKKYAGSSTDGGPATVANKVIGSLHISGNGIDELYDGSANKVVDLSTFFGKAGGEITGDVILDKKLIVTRDQIYGTSLPESGTEGQLFFLIKHNT